MSPYHIPGGPSLDPAEVDRFLAAAPGDRRAFLRQMAGLGVALPTLGALRLQDAKAQDANAQDQQMPGMEGTPPSGYVGSNPESPGTGAESPVPLAIEPFELYNPMLQPVQAGPKQITLVAQDTTRFVAKDVPYAGWSFSGTIPGPVLHVVEGDTIDFTFSIAPDATTAHSVDFHSAQTPPDKNYKTILPGEKFSWSFAPKHPGAFLYHCGTPPVLMHIGSGMYGAMIVDPKDGWSPAQELVLVQSDFYLDDSGTGIKVPDYSKMVGNGMMDYVVFNGYANQYVENPIAVKAGEPIRIFVVNAGPNAYSTFHVVGAIFDRVYVNANPENALVGLQSWTIGPGDGACFELTLDEPGQYPAVNHAFGHAAHGAIAILHAT